MALSDPVSIYEDKDEEGIYKKDEGERGYNNVFEGWKEGRKEGRRDLKQADEW